MASAKNKAMLRAKKRLTKPPKAQLTPHTETTFLEGMPEKHKGITATGANSGKVVKSWVLPYGKVTHGNKVGHFNAYALHPEKR